MAPGIDNERLNAVVEPVARAHGAEVVGIEFKTEGNGWILRIFVEKLGSAEGGATTRDAAVDLALCSGVARDLSPALDVADPIPHRYSLEVSSPGIERPLYVHRDYVRFTGQTAKIRLRTPRLGQKTMRGRISANPGTESVRIEEDGKTTEVNMGEIESAHLVFELKKAPKPGQSKKRK